MRRLQGYGWLLVGAVAALAAALLGGWPVLGSSAPPPPWDRRLAALLLFWAGAGLYFRSHWAATLAVLHARSRRQARVAARLRELAEEIERSAWILRDNLREVSPGSGAGHGDLYLGGAIAHAERLPELARRCRELGAALLAGEDDAEPSDSVSADD